MGKKGRPKARPKPKQTGKKRSKGKRTTASRVSEVRKLLQQDLESKYVGNLLDYEPVRKDDSDETEEDMEEQDLDVFQQPHLDLKFLTEVNLESDSKSKRNKRKTLENIEESYEKQPRLAGEEWRPKNHSLLPLKDKSGVIQQSSNIVDNGVENNTAMDSRIEPTMGCENASGQVEVNGDLQEETCVALKTLSAVDLLKIRQEEINSKKTLITSLVSAILEDPQANIDKLKEMNKLCAEKDSNVSVTVRKLAIVSLLEVFKDIIPGYHIRPLSDTEKNTKVSKDVKKVRNFEDGLLKGYQRYLEILEQIIKERKMYRRSRKIDQKGLPIIAFNCLCDLLKSVPHFNYRTNIMTVLVPKMNDDSADGQVSRLCCETVHSVFKADSVGEISLEIVQLISKFVKSQSFKVRPCVLETFLSLRLQDADLTKKDKGAASEKPKYKNKLDRANKKRMSKNDRKRQKELKKIEHELQEAEAVEGKTKSKKMQTEIIKLVFFMYFRILKTSGVCPLLAPVLAGLSKYTHLINVDFFADLMAVLKTLINSEEIPACDKLHCILTAFKILSGQGEALNIDPQTFYRHLYTSLLDINPVSSDSDVSVLMECLDVMLNKRRKQVSFQRLLAYVKRLCTVALQQCPATSLALLSCARLFLQMHSKTEVILDSECAGSGVFRPHIPDPEYTNADSTTLWELAMFHNHYEPTLRTLAFHISLGNPSQGPGSLPSHLSRKNPLEVFEEYKEDRQTYEHLNNCLVRTPKKQKSGDKSFSSSSWCQKVLEEEVKDCFAWTAEQDESVDFGKSFTRLTRFTRVT